MISNERILELSLKGAEIARELLLENCKTFDQKILSQNHQQIIVLKKLEEMFSYIIDRRISNED